MREFSTETTLEDAKAYFTEIENSNFPSVFSTMLMDMMSFSHASSVSCHWWHEKDGTPKIHITGERINLMHSELSEATEGERKDLMSDKIEGFLNVEEELADALHRIFDYAKGRGLRLGEAYVAKGLYNLKREDHKIDVRHAEGGKQF